MKSFQTIEKLCLANNVVIFEFEHNVLFTNNSKTGKNYGQKLYITSIVVV